ncbi:MAG: hypothetical protein AAGK66_01150 [Pseudomonadota bacterium]
MSALSSHAAPAPQTQDLPVFAQPVTFPEETRYLVDYRTRTVASAPRPNLLVRRRKRLARRSTR